MEERAGLIGDGEDEGCWHRHRGWLRRRRRMRLEQGEAGEVVGIVFHGGGEDLGAVLAGGELAGDGGHGGVGTLHDLAHAAGGVLGDGLGDGGMGGEEALALG